jgi:hypothetical protein
MQTQTTIKEANPDTHQGPSPGTSGESPCRDKPAKIMEVLDFLRPNDACSRRSKSWTARKKWMSWISMLARVPENTRLHLSLNPIARSILVAL